MSDMAEIKGLVEKINPTLVELRSEVDELKSSAPKDVLTEEKWNRMLEGDGQKPGILSQMEEIQKKQAKMQAVLDRPGGEAVDEKKAERKQAYLDYMRKGALGGMSRDMQPIEIKAMSTDVNPDGGYLTQPEVSGKIAQRVFETSPLRQVADIQQTSSTSILVVLDDDEAAARWVAEGASGGQTDTAQIGRAELPLHKIEADPRITVEMLTQGFVDVENWHANKVADKISRTENTAFVSGDGVGKPRGFTTYAAWASAGTYERDKIEQIVTGAAAAITADGLISLQASLKEAYQPGAVFGMHRTTYGSALKLKGADNYFFSPVIMRDGQATMQLLGKPVIFMSDMPLEGAGDEPVVYGDFSRGYCIVDGVNLTVLRDPYTAKGFVTFYTTKFVGGAVVNFDAIKLNTCST